MPHPTPYRGRSHRLAAPVRLLLGTAVLALAACARLRGSGGEVVFALEAPLSQDYGASTRRGAELAVNEVNAAGGINGRKLRLEVQDDSADKQRAIAVADALVRDPNVVAVAGPVNSGTTIAAAPIYGGEGTGGHGLPVVATTATSPDVSRLGDWIYRIASSDSANAVALAATARSLAPSVAVLYSNDEYGRGLANSFSHALEQGGGRVAEYDPYTEGMADYTPYLKRMQRGGVQLVFVAGLDASAATIISQARALGMQARFIGGDGLVPLADKGPAYDGTLVGLLYHRDAGERPRAFAEAFHRAYGKDPDPFAAAAYDAVKLLAEAAGKNGASREGIRRYLNTLGRAGGAAAFEGATGSLRFDANGDPDQKAFAIGEIRNGTIQLTKANR